ncbi:branched-chain amino acid ABC transporter permease [Bradyrhizobium sp. Leo121]|uniref:branched-chain amino acid ABC transporter permease n=1 Tax=Bradyrhizobium sp. Leo121 TaxID=1571195 RepID=UPI0010293FEE|nr:branched-chain amino acid ABC transporter permease [Bradyrhizobium sp. Leo121]RZN32102.1 branched-chain amino acid ABC transporter permease [Bradyrhizobium sp. Leo121]
MRSAPLTPVASSAARSLRQPRAVGWIALVLLALTVLPAVLPSYQVSVVTQVLIFSVLAMSIDILAGFAGRTSLGHGAIFGVSSYVAIYWTSTLGGDIWIGIALGILAATALAGVFAALAIRTSGVYFLLLTLALGMIVWGVCLRWTTVTGGENGLRGVGRPAFIADHASFYYAVLIIVAPLTWLMWRLVHSPFGLTLRGIRDSESRMRSLGYNVPLHLFVAFVLSGFFAGVAGGLYVLFNNFVSPSTVQLSQSVSALLMAITGGVGTLLGSFVGAAGIIVLENAVSAYTARWPSVLGIAFVLIMIFAPEGVVGRARLLLARRRSRSSKPNHSGG